MKLQREYALSILHDIYVSPTIRLAWASKELRHTGMAINHSASKLTLLKYTLFASCSAFGIIIPSQGHAQLSIMGVLDTRAPFTAPPVQKEKNIPTATPQITTPHLPISRSTAPSAHRETTPHVNNESNNENSSLSADELDFSKDLGVITARGNVEIIYNDRILVADTVSYNQNKDMVSASGNVQLIEPDGNVLFSEFMEISSDLKKGIAQGMVLSLADNSLIRAQSGKKDGRFTIVEDAEYSVCQKCADDPERPLAWKLSAKEVKHDAELQRVEYSDVFFELFDVPVLYTPIFWHADPSKKRETGFLFPGYGSRGDIGSYINTPFFWNISQSKNLAIDPTWYFDDNQPYLDLKYQQNLRNGEMRLGGSVTYIPEGGAGQSQNNSGDEIRGHIDSEGLFDINNTWRWGFDINYASDDTYIRRYSIDDNTENAQLISQLYTEGFRKRNYTTLNLSTYQEQRDIKTETLQDSKIEYLFSHVGQPSRSGAYWKTDATLMHISHRNDVRSSRLAADTSWVVPYTSDTGDLITLEANIITAGYFTSESNAASSSTIDGGTDAQIVPSLSLEWRKPLSRSHMDGRVNEVLEPMFKIKAAPNVGQRDFQNEDSQDFEFDDTNLFKTKRFTGLDRIDGGHRIDYGFNWGVFGNDGGYSILSIGQSYRLRDDTTYSSNSGHEDNLSDIVGRIDVSPSNFINVLYRYRLDKDELTLNRSETTLAVGPASTRFNLSHLYIESTGNDSQYGTREEISTSLNNQWAKNWSSRVYSTYRINDPEGNVNYGGQITYEDECTALYFDFKRNFSEDRDLTPSDTISLRFELKSLGDFGVF